jgi:phage terminase large subunit-like protein
MRLALRLGGRPQVVVTTTPTADGAAEALAGRAAGGGDAGTTRDNAANLPDGFADEMEVVLGGGRLARQELEGELMDAPEGAVTMDGIATLRAPMLCAPRRVVVGVDPQRMAARADRGGGAGRGRAGLCAGGSQRAWRGAA